MSEKKEPTTAELTDRKEKLLAAGGVHQYNKAVIEAELLQMNQEILHIDKELRKRYEAATPAIKSVVPDEVQSSEGVPL